MDEPHIEHDLDRALVDVQDRDAEIARLRAENEALRLEHTQAMRWSEALHDDVEARLRKQLASADRRASILADAADLIATQRDESPGLLRELATTLHAEPAEAVVELAKRRVAERDGARSKVTARDRALDACAARIANLLDDRDRLLGIAQRNGEDRDHWRSVAETQIDLTAAVLEDVARMCAVADAARAYLTAPPAFEGGDEHGFVDPPREAYERLCEAVEAYDGTKARVP